MQSRYQTPLVLCNFTGFLYLISNILPLIPNFNLNQQFCFSGPNFPKNGTAGMKHKKQTSLLNMNIEISLGTKFQLNLIILIFRTKFPQKGYFQSKLEKVNTPTSTFSNFILNWQICCFFGPKMVCPIETGKNEQYLQILDLRISLGTKSQLVLTILIYPKRVFLILTKKVSSTIEFYIFELVYNHRLNIKTSPSFMWNRALREKFNVYFSWVFCNNPHHNILALFNNVA